jgi:prepilin-type processing-associated H-X9-DG protein
MSGFFDYDKGDLDAGIQPLTRTIGSPKEEKKVADLVLDGKAAVRLMFAELPSGIESREPRFTDGVLEYEMASDRNGVTDINNKDESIGFNHFVAKRWVGHVAFLDGHVEGIVLPNTAKKANGSPNYEDKDLKNLTGQLCDGQEISSEIRAKMR